MLKPLALLCCLGALAMPAHAIVTCPKPANPAATPASLAPAETDALAHRLAGMLPAGEASSPVLTQFATAANEGWQAYTQTFSQPLRNWAAKAAKTDPGTEVFYPFAGPDLPTVMAIYPGASRYVMISDQYATAYFDPFALKEGEQVKVFQELGDAWTRFGRLGFFLTQELNKGGGNKLHVSPTMILMAFAARLGYEVRAVRPTCVDAGDNKVHPLDAKGARWGSVRLDLRKDGRDIVVDYVQMDLSNGGLKRPEVRALIDAFSKTPVLLKAASHLPQMAPFSILANAIRQSSPLVVQDETGIEYDDLAKSFNVKLYGEYIAANRQFKEAVNASLMKAYKDRAKEVVPLDFKYGYDKRGGSAIQVAIRK